MTGGGGPADEDLPVFDAIEPVPAHVHTGRPRANAPRLGPGRGAGVAAAILVLLVVGIAAGSASLVPDIQGSTNPSTTDANSPRPSGSDGDEVCRPPRQGQFPAVTMGVQGSRQRVSGVFGFGSGYGQQSQEPGWQIPSPDRGLVAAPGDDLELGASFDVCFRHLVVDYARTRIAPEAGGIVLQNPLPLFNATIAPSSGRVLLDGLPDGDWIVRVTAHFETLETVADDVVTVTYFRILAGKGPFLTPVPTVAPAPTLLISPAVPCGTLLPTANVGVSLFVADAAPIAGAVDRETTPPEVHARSGDLVRIIVDGEACAVRWNIELFNVETGDTTTVDVISNPADDPAYAAQNRWTIPVVGNRILTATLRFPGGLEIVRTWRVTVDPFTAPALYLVGSDGRRFQASAGCGLSVRLSNGYEAGDDCGSIGYAPGPEALMVRAYRVIHLDLPGWQIISWGASCGRVTTVDTEQFESPDGCGLGGGASDDASPLVDPPAFVLPPGDTVVQIGIGAIDGAGNQFNLTYYAHVIAR